MPRTSSRSVATPAPPAPPAGIAPLTSAQVEAQTDRASFDRGRAYARQDRLFGRLRRGPAIAAGCHGSSGGPHRVTATLAATGDGEKRPKANPVGYACSCPRGGFCKHVVALLLDWIADPAAFE